MELAPDGAEEHVLHRKTDCGVHSVQLITAVCVNPNGACKVGKADRGLKQK